MSSVSMQQTKHPRTSHAEASFGGYVLGFVSSVTLTLAAYALATRHSFSHRVLVGSLALLAIVQFVVQLFFFLHLGRETKPRWKLVMFLFMLLVIGIVVIGSLWIMHNLNYNMLTPQAINTYMQSQDGL